MFDDEHDERRWAYRLHEKMERMMAAIDDLNNAVVALQAEQAAVDTAVTDLVDQVAALNAALTAAGTNDPAIQAAAQNINNVVTDLAQQAAKDPGPQAAPPTA